MKPNKKEMLKGYRCAIQDCRAEPYAMYGGVWLCEGHTKDKWQEMLEREQNVKKD